MTLGCVEPKSRIKNLAKMQTTLPVALEPPSCPSSFSLLSFSGFSSLLSRSFSSGPSSLTSKRFFQWRKLLAHLACLIVWYVLCVLSEELCASGVVCIKYCESRCLVVSGNSDLCYISSGWCRVARLYFFISLALGSTYISETRRFF